MLCYFLATAGRTGKLGYAKCSILVGQLTKLQLCNSGPLGVHDMATDLLEVDGAI